MLWIACEKEDTISQSFTHIAVKLKFPGTPSKDYGKNRTHVLDWLQHTGEATILIFLECRWLLVFDSVKSVDLLMKFRPITSRGQAMSQPAILTFVSILLMADLKSQTWIRKNTLTKRERRIGGWEVTVPYYVECSSETGVARSRTMTWVSFGGGD